MIPRRELSLAEKLVRYSGCGQWATRVVGAGVDKEGGGECIEVFLGVLSSILAIAE